ncbi:copper(I)-binding protein CorA [Methylotuvimicrobium buryatense]|uniref:Copper(I)-binding protein CorA domain-containing protein n=1 Tax=Methylotuvimicrobium buryatense TaxID=95641 RepID=A0A4P9UR71_METBY|nr:copper(I)-binding protein CorA [Methylotuvimicrobium buryatense]QCW82136.1 hypothetical protein EQU24_07680 [Methylotuvimicrobium buryatense]
MKKTSKLKALTFAAAAMGALVSLPSNAATVITPDVHLFEFTPDNSSRTLNVRADAWYNLTMGYLGWTHHANWGTMSLRRGQPVTITVDASDIDGFHPGITVWFRQQGRAFAGPYIVDAHSYSQSQDVINLNAVVDDDPVNPRNSGRSQRIHMEFIANAFDRDGMGDVLPEAFDQSAINKVLDGEPGKVSLTFTPPRNGLYQFVVGGINPDEDIDTSKIGAGNRYPVNVHVSFPSR